MNMVWMEKKNGYAPVGSMYEICAGKLERKNSLSGENGRNQVLIY
jgi:hypothetical protein